MKVQVIFVRGMVCLVFDYGAQHEKTETLNELINVRKSPWKLDYSWSEEAKGLREIAVKSPWLVDEKFILGYFRTLRIVDKGVTEVDENFLNFPNLEELTLSANKLQTVQSLNLPQSLHVLELCANEISHLEDLCVCPPPLIHLGLGHNLLTVIDDYIAGQYWPHLLSLDLSHNNLCDLMEVVRKLQTLPKLRNILLQGNPLSLVPGYRGYVIDSLRNLDFLDDISISADEKHHFKGLAKRKEYILDEAKVLLQTGFIKGIPQPEELKSPEDQPEFPIITHNYYVQFMFLEDKSGKVEIFQVLHDAENGNNEAVGSTSNTCVTDGKQDNVDGKEDDGVMSRLSDAQNSQGGSIAEKNVNFAVEANTARSHSVVSGLQLDVGDMGSEAKTPDPNINGSDSDSPSMQLAPIRSASSTWQEDMELNWEEMVVRDDLLSLRNFFKQGMDITVMEEKILSYPSDQVQDGVLSPAGGKDKGKADKKDKKDDKKKDDPKDDGKKKKKKGEPDIDLTHMPGEYTTLAEFHISLDEFLEGEYVFENVFVKDWHEASGSQTPTSEMSGTSKDKKKKSDKKKDAKEKDVRRSPKTDRRASIKTKDKGKAAGDPAGDEEAAAPPPPLEVHVKVKLHHWKTAMDSIRDEEQAQAAIAEAAAAAAAENGAD
ncbi:hypothetical protein LSH36_476g02066 [Paralvinella palmiformis]|uniref:Leucine-rich repeat-containing protein 43 n=1 Tax=Paralvinella palmiformis TaxID=53620 RepID=A0AAD9JAJ0_9ANNE|nr:hypothetical protein LSH36_476g02066 [Paralvinella palmiformis]